MFKILRAEGFDGEPLDEHAVDAVLLHPAEVAVDGLGVLRTKDVGDGTIGVAKARGKLFVVAEFGHVGPKVNGRSARLEAPAATIVDPTAARTVPFGGEPTLIAAHDLAGEGRNINAGGRFARKRLHLGNDFVAGLGCRLSGEDRADRQRGKNEDDRHAELQHGKRLCVRANRATQLT